MSKIISQVYDVLLIAFEKIGESFFIVEAIEFYQILDSPRFLTGIAKGRAVSQKIAGAYGKRKTLHGLRALFAKSVGKIIDSAASSLTDHQRAFKSIFFGLYKFLPGGRGQKKFTRPFEKTLLDLSPGGKLRLQLEIFI